MISAAGVASHAKFSPRERWPVYAAALTTSSGRKTRKPVAAASPIPSTTESARSRFDMILSIDHRHRVDLDQAARVGGKPHHLHGRGGRLGVAEIFRPHPVERVLV